MFHDNKMNVNEKSNQCLSQPNESSQELPVGAYPILEATLPGSEAVVYF